MHTWYRLIIFALSAAAIAAALGGCVSTPPSGSSCNGHVSIASELPTTGTDGTGGLPAQNGVQLAVQQNNNLGGGYTLSLMKYNDDSNPDQGAKNVAAMVDNVCLLGFVGPLSSDVAIKEIPISENAGLGMISPSNTNPGLTIESLAAIYGIDWATLHPPGKKESYFRISGNDVAQGALDADLAIMDLSAKTAYVVDDQGPYGVGLAHYFTNEFREAGGAILGHAGITTPGLAATIAATPPDVVFYGGVTTGGGGALKAQLVAAGYTGPMFGGDGIADDIGFIQQAGGEAANNTYGTVSAPDPSTFVSGPAAKFVADYKAAYPGQNLGVYSANAYDAANVIITAIKNIIQSGQVPTRAAAIDRIQNTVFKPETNFIGVTEHSISFDQHGDNKCTISSGFQVQNGQWVFWQQVGFTEGSPSGYLKGALPHKGKIGVC